MARIIPPLLAGVLTVPAFATEAPREITWQQLPEPPRQGNFVGEPGLPIDAMNEGFLNAHPDVRWRREGLTDYENRHYARAMKHLLRAAKYADKPAQAMIAEMHWEGIGVPQDRALGYVWMDLAAERMYPNFLILRERYWHAMDEAERKDAIERGQAVFARYADDVAKPRLESVLRHEARKVTGSHLGYVGTMTVVHNTGPLAVPGMTQRGDSSYAKKYWSPEQYWQSQDATWKDPPKGSVEVGELEAAPERLPPDH
ncbi:sel1 repeat family protein [Xanthomonadaceae bacterium JHOS43]|nr:sel1 repeat family protein [Xanthomonadaceae bacterium JHOS43]MCX7563038.1 sel1 repeat family protein [Xanthomonadaceae bacterium XH05]